MDNTFDAAQSAFEDSLPVEAEDESPEQPTEASAAEPASKEVDISHLPEEAQIFLRAREREMQADATHKWQEASAMRAEAEQSIAFIQRLNSDPNFATEVHKHLNESLSAAGYLAPDAPQSYYDDEPLYEDQGPDPYQADIAELKQWRNNFEERIEIERMAAQLDHGISRVRAENPTWDDDDMAAVIDLGFATQGDMSRAADIYKASQDRTLSKYLERKGSVSAPPSVQSTSGSPVGEPPRTDQDLRNAAMERIRQELG